jgi:hypothetical protein
MQLANIKDLLSRYREVLSGAEDKKELLIRSIESAIGATLPPDAITVTKGVLTVRASMMLKNMIFMHKEKILKNLHDSGRTDIFEIR